MTRPGTFGSGQSGNPRGRPKRGASLTEIVRKKLGDIVIVADADGSLLEKRRREIIADKLLEMAQGGNLTAMQIVLERVDGKVPQPPVTPPPTDDRDALTVQDVVRAAMEEA